ncbi:MAG: ketoacyl-ACP synthase III [Salinivirgaceae bacterium]|nr:ketoacyl-ACP synthase III [Salinivirgaceae bacterium]
MAKIVKTSFHLPANIVDNNNLSKRFPDLDVEKLEKRIGIKQRHIVSENQTALDLATEAAKLTLQGYNKGNIDFIILCTQSPDYFLPTSACILQDRLGLSKNIGAFDFNLGCSGYVYGLSIAKGLVDTGSAKAVLLVVAETYSKHIHPLDKANLSIFGDGAAASIVEKGDNGIGEFVFGTDGSGYEKLIVKNGGFKNRLETDVKNFEYGTGNITNNNCLYMDGPEIFNFTIETIPAIIEKTLLKNNLTVDEVDYFIFHQANKFMLDHLRNKLGIPKSKFYINLESTGNTVSATIPIALTRALDEGLIVKGNKVLLAGFGVGLSWASTIITI